MTIETHTKAQKRKTVGAIHEDLDDVTEALTKAREITGALTVDGKGLDAGLVTACTGWAKQLDHLLHLVSAESSEVARRMGGDGGPKITENVDHEHAKAVVAAAADAEEVAPLHVLPDQEGEEL